MVIEFKEELEENDYKLIDSEFNVTINHFLLWLKKMVKL